MCEALEQRISDLEDLLGLNIAENSSELLNFDVAPLKKQLCDLQAGFIMQVPVEKLYRLREVFTDVNKFLFNKKFFVI